MELRRARVLAAQRRQLGHELLQQLVPGREREIAPERLRRWLDQRPSRGPPSRSLNPADEHLSPRDCHLVGIAAQGPRHGQTTVIVVADGAWLVPVRRERAAGRGLRAHPERRRAKVLRDHPARAAGGVARQGAKVSRGDELAADAGGGLLARNCGVGREQRRQLRPRPVKLVSREEVEPATRRARHLLRRRVAAVRREAIVPLAVGVLPRPHRIVGQRAIIVDRVEPLRLAPLGELRVGRAAHLHRNVPRMRGRVELGGAVGRPALAEACTRDVVVVNRHEA